MNWMIEDSRLDSDQKGFLKDFAGAPQQATWWLKGFAGSGKSVLLVHALKAALAAKPEGRYAIVLYTNSLIDLFRTGLPSELSAKVPIMTHYKFMTLMKQDPHVRYTTIFVDEVQDLPQRVLSTLRQRSDRVLVAGDEGQSIFDDSSSPAQIMQLLEPRTLALTIVHRLSKRIVETVNALFPNKGLTTATLGRSALVEIEIAQATSMAEEVAYIWRKADNAAVPGNPCAILLPKHDHIIAFANAVLTHLGKPLWPRQNVTKRDGEEGGPDYHKLNAHLKAHGVGLIYEGNDYHNLSTTVQAGKVLLMTYHSAKGLDFENVFLPFLSADTEIWRNNEARASTLFYVALTRSRLNLFVSYTGKPHPYVARIPATGVRRRTVPEPKAAAVAAETEDFIF